MLLQLLLGNSPTETSKSTPDRPSSPLGTRRAPTSHLPAEDSYREEAYRIGLRVEPAPLDNLSSLPTRGVEPSWPGIEIPVSAKAVRRPRSRSNKLFVGTSRHRTAPQTALFPYPHNTRRRNPIDRYALPLTTPPQLLPISPRHPHQPPESWALSVGTARSDLRERGTHTFGLVVWPKTRHSRWHSVC